jgi:hypothetical protein
VTTEDYSFFEIWRDRFIWTLILGTVTSVVLYLIHFAGGWPHNMQKTCFIAYAAWAVIGWFVIDNAD